MLDSIVHGLVVAHNKTMMVTTYLPDTFILKRQKVFLVSPHIRYTLTLTYLSVGCSCRTLPIMDLQTSLSSASRG